MKRVLIVILFAPMLSFGQTQEAKQLLLNVEKLAQLKALLAQMKTGYQILSKGYAVITDISKGNFNLHQTFLDGLLEVSPAVRKYQRVADIISIQIKIVKEAKGALNELKASRQFSLTEIDYLGGVYGNLLNAGLQTIDQLALVITAGKLRMSDDERLKAIDSIYDEVIEQYEFMSEFSNSTAILSMQREKESQDVNLLRKMHGF